MTVTVYDSTGKWDSPQKIGLIIAEIPDEVVEMVDVVLQEGTFQSLLDGLPIKKTTEIMEVIKNRIDVYDYQPGKKKEYSSWKMGEKVFPYLDMIELMGKNSSKLVPVDTWKILKK